MKIVEFVGLPGVGKSTVCKRLVADIKKTQKVFTYRDIILMLHFRKLYIPLIYLNPFRWKYIRLLRAYAKAFSDVSKNAIHVLLAMYDAVCVLDFIFKDSIALLEEGFVQTLTSIPHLHPIKNEEHVERILNLIKHKHDITVVECFAEPELVVRRLRQRNGCDRFNAISDDQSLLEALRIKQSNLSVLTRHFDSLLQLNTNMKEDVIAQALSDHPMMRDLKKRG